MKKALIVILLILVVLALILIFSYNSLVSAQTDVDEARSNIMTQLQRRADLIPNLVQTVNKYTEHETEVFAAVNEARAAVMGASTVSEMAAADKELSAAITSLVAVAEAYPELTSDTVYIGLMDELAGTENRIATARTDYNANVRSYNTATRKFPGVILAKLFNFTEAPYFEADASASTVPVVS